MNRKEHKRKAQGKFTHNFNRHVKTSFKIQTDDILHFSNSENKAGPTSFIQLQPIQIQQACIVHMQRRECGVAVVSQRFM
eukprot:scaffold3643_cov132-Skeletonema_menzelii.AAC.1